MLKYKLGSCFKMKQVTQNRTPITHEEWNELIALFSSSRNHFTKEQNASARWVHPLDLLPLPGVSYEALADFLFRCETCALIGGDIQWYKIILDTIGGYPCFRSSTDKDDLRRGSDDLNLSKILKDDETYYQSSGLNYIEDVGYVCDHCRDSVFQDPV